MLRRYHGVDRDCRELLPRVLLLLLFSWGGRLVFVHMDSIKRDSKPYWRCSTVLLCEEREGAHCHDHNLVVFIAYQNNHAYHFRFNYIYLRHRSEKL